VEPALEHSGDPSAESSREHRATLGEAVVVLGLPTVIFLGVTVWRWLHGTLSEIVLSDRRLLTTLGIEVACTALLLPWLMRRRWIPRRVAGPPAPRDVWRGLGVWLAGAACSYLTVLAIHAVDPSVVDTFAVRPFSGTISAPMVVLASVINPVFEEFLWLGYGVGALQSRVGLRAACVLSVLLRVSVHLYQGTQVVVGVVPLALFFTWYYARTRRLWPVVVAHAMFDAFALGTVHLRG
jgi:uncharacterized protein